MSAYESRLNETVLLGTENDSAKILIDKKSRPPDKGTNSKNILIFLSSNTSFVCSKEPSQGDGPLSNQNTCSYSVWKK